MARQPAALARYWANKRGHKRKRRTRTVVRYKTRHVSRKRHHRRHRRGRSGGAGIRVVPLALATAGLAYVTSAQGPAFVRENMAKVPGVATFGPLATAGLIALGVDKFVKPNKWLKLFGLAGVVLAASKVGEQGANFKWVGDDGVYDLGDDDDMGDVDDMGDYDD